MTVEIRRGTSAFVEREPGRLSRHGFSFGPHYDPENLRLGPLVCHDDHLLARGRGFETHRHSGLVIVTYVVSGALDHDGPTGRVTVPAGSLAVLRTGPGVEHAEVAAVAQTRFVQAWLTDDDADDVTPSYEVLDPGTVSVEPLTGMRLEVRRLGDHETTTLPAAPRVHGYVARGALLRFSLAEPLAEGDAFRFVDEPAHEVTAAVPSTLLLWSFA
ncbi:pirin family protein [Nocardioides marinquilinus]|uniref:Pirin family protein n=1 Tax=Nocardioides marinquilinus TaxID=1210400 RepID=A0ABP9P8I7_9ACTN